MLSGDNVPYEILRKPSGDLALAVSAGAMGLPPGFYLKGRDLWAGDGERMVVLRNLPKDVCQELTCTKGLLLLEVSASRVERIHEVQA